MEKAGFPPTSTWALVNGDTPLATQVHPRGVANGEPPVNTGASGVLESISDTPQVVVANGSGYDADAELGRVQEKFPELIETAARCRCTSPVVSFDADGDSQCAKCGRPA